MSVHVGGYPTKYNQPSVLLLLGDRQTEKSWGCGSVRQLQPIFKVTWSVQSEFVSRGFRILILVLS